MMDDIFYHEHLHDSHCDSDSQSPNIFIFSLHHRHVGGLGDSQALAVTCKVQIFPSQRTEQQFQMRTHLS